MSALEELSYDIVKAHGGVPIAIGMIGGDERK